MEVFDEKITDFDHCIKILLVQRFRKVPMVKVDLDIQTHFPQKLPAYRLEFLHQRLNQKKYTWRTTFG